MLARAAELRPKCFAFSQLLAETRLALGELASLEEEYRSGFKREPLNYFAALRLCDVLVAEGKRSDAQQIATGFGRAARAQYKENAREAIDLLDRHLLYVTGDFAALEKHARGDGSLAGHVALFHALMEQGRTSEAVKIRLEEPGEGEEPFHLLTIALAYADAGNEAEAVIWRGRALKALEDGETDYAQAATLLRREAPPTQAELDDLVLPAKLKAIVLAALGQKRSNMGAALRAAARRFNVERDYPYHLIQRVTNEAR
jgi:Arc/MetJ family transcription regulator